MPADKSIALSLLQVDTENARLPESEASQNAAILRVATEQGDYLLELADDIVEFGIDPLARTAVLKVGSRYTVVEGNRRLTALRALDTPALVSGAFNTAQQKRLADLAKRFAKAPIAEIPCVVFEEEELPRLIHFVRMRHTGLNGGRGLDPWGAIERDRFLRRHGNPSAEGQVLEFLRSFAGIDIKPSSRGAGFITTLARLLNTPAVRDRLGLEMRNKWLYTTYPRDEVVKGLRHIVEELQKGKQTSRTLHSAAQRQAYAAKLPARVLPDAKRAFSTSVELGSEEEPAPAAAGAKPAEKKAAKKAPKSVTAPGLRKHLVPRTVHLNPPENSRIAAVYGELYRINVHDFANAAGVLLRVFIELSVGHHLETGKILTADQRMSQPLSMRLKALAADMLKRGTISAELEKHVRELADAGRKKMLNAELTTFNQYVHSKYTWARADQVIYAWDDFQEFLLALWP